LKHRLEQLVVAFFPSATSIFRFQAVVVLNPFVLWCQTWIDLWRVLHLVHFWLSVVLFPGFFLHVTYNERFLLSSLFSENSIMFVTVYIVW
jgi:hypothetical protein